MVECGSLSAQCEKGSYSCEFSFNSNTIFGKGVKLARQVRTKSDLQQALYIDKPTERNFEAHHPFWLHHLLLLLILLLRALYLQIFCLQPQTKCGLTNGPTARREGPRPATRAYHNPDFSQSLSSSSQPDWGEILLYKEQGVLRRLLLEGSPVEHVVKNASAWKSTTEEDSNSVV